ncbi:hypothetical protein KP509_24G009200 [Ceratopteris richardii]|uniref:Uncharacterized protein n=1 Tax=Ceratopteris richardii TaxID=49495 RepID=A0A8T2RV31_CERRI|nr:hypothetical protein KP509_24G009200 [Ceratopteris richardii]
MSFSSIDYSKKRFFPPRHCSPKVLNNFRECNGEIIYVRVKAYFFNKEFLCLLVVSLFMAGFFHILVVSDVGPPLEDKTSDASLELSGVKPLVASLPREDILVKQEQAKRTCLIDDFFGF